MKIVVSVMCLFSQALIADASPPATTQPSLGRGRGTVAAPRPNYDPIVFNLDHANCYEVSHVISDAFSGCSSIPVEQSNSIVFVGPPETQAAARKLIGQMDDMAKHESGPGVVVVSIKNRRIDELIDQLNRVIDGRRLRVSGDRGRSKVLLRGDKGEIQQAEALLQQLDSPAPAVPVEFAFIQAKATGGAEGPPIPADLADVAKELERFGKLTMLGRLSTVAVEGERFGVEGQIVPGIKAEVRGFVTGGGAEGAIKLEVKASLEMNSHEKSGEKLGGPPTIPYFHVETVVATQRGEYLVLGSAPTGSDLGESAILVMHVRK